MGKFREDLERVGFVYMPALPLAERWWDPVIGDFTDEEQAVYRLDARINEVMRGEVLQGWDGL